MFEYEVNSEDGMLSIYVDGLDDDVLVHNNLLDPAEPIVCILKSSANEGATRKSVSQLKHNVFLSGASSSLYVLLQDKIHFTLDQFQNFTDITIEKAFKEDEYLGGGNAFNRKTDTNYWYSAIDIKTIGEQIIVDPNIKLYEPVDGAKNLELTLRQMLSDVSETTAGVLVCNIFGSHWINLMLLQCAGEYFLLYKDSLYKESFAKREIKSLAEKLNINFVCSTSCEQRDQSACGIFAMQNTRILSKEIQSCIHSEEAMRIFLARFINNNIDFCSQEDANLLRNSEFAEQFICGKYNQARIEHARIDLYREVRNHHISELEYIKEVLNEFLQTHGIYKKISTADGDQSALDSNLIRLDIAIDQSTPFISERYSYLYTFRWNDDGLIQSALMQMFAGQGLSITLAPEHVQNRGKVIRFSALSTDHQNAIQKVNFDDLVVGRRFTLCLNDFIKEVISGKDVDLIKMILDRHHLAYIDDYIVPIVAPIDVEEDLVLSRRSANSVLATPGKLTKATITTDVGIKPRLAMLEDNTKNLRNISEIIQYLKPFLANNSQIQKVFTDKVNLTSNDEPTLMKSLLLMNTLLDVTLTSEFEYKPTIFALQKVTNLLLDAIRIGRVSRIALCSKILTLAGANHYFAVNMDGMAHVFKQLKSTDTGFDNISKLLISYAEHSLAQESTLSKNFLDALSHILPLAVKADDQKLVGKIKTIFDSILKKTVLCLLKKNLNQIEQHAEHQKIIAYAKAIVEMGSSSSSWQSNLLDNLLILIRTIPEIKYADEIEKLLTNNPSLKKGRDYKLTNLLRILNDKLPEACSLIANLFEYKPISSKPTYLPEAADLSLSCKLLEQPILASEYQHPSGEEKTLEVILQELARQNQSNIALIDIVAKQYELILKIYQQDSRKYPQGLPICDWYEGQIMEFSKAFREWLGEGADKHQISFEQILELLAIVKRTNIVACGNDPRDTQMLSVLLILKLGSQDAKTGMLLQIATGEGKSTTTAILAATKALLGHKVDVITSSSILAKRDAEDPLKQELFKMLGLTVSHNINSVCDIRKGLKECYKADIVYGDVASFQYDWIYHNFKQYGTRGNRGHEVVIVDEVDSMLIDESAKIAMVSGRLAGSEYMQGIYAAMWQFMSTLDQQTVFRDGKYFYVNGMYELNANGDIILDDPNNGSIYHIDMEISEFRQERLAEYAKQLVMSNKIEVPNHLKQYTFDQASEWTKSLLRAKAMSLEKDYVITIDQKGQRVIAPVDYAATGVINENTQWSDALHQFLQLKHSLKITSETLTTCYISNTYYFKLYGGNIYGMSGTLGSSEARDLLRVIYDVDVIEIPTYKPKKFTELKSHIATNKEEHLRLISNAVQEQIGQSRAVLVITESIAQAKDIYQLLSVGIRSSKLKLYTRVDNDEAEAIVDNVEVMDVIVATNLAGRGTDLKTSVQLEKNGGLHVIVSYLPMNLRVEQQAFGRTSRQGNCGTAELILNTEEIAINLEQEKIPNDIDVIKSLRDHFENNRIKRTKLYDALVIDLEDKLFASFMKFHHQLKSQNAEDKSIDCRYKLLQLEESFGFLLKEIKRVHKADKQEIAKLTDSADFTDIASQHFTHLRTEAWKIFNLFKQQISVEFGKGLGIMNNSFLLVRAAVNAMENSYAQSLTLLERAMDIETHHYNFSAHYNHAYALIRQESQKCKEKGKVMNAYIGQAHAGMVNAKHYIEDFVIPSIEAITMFATEAGDTDLLKQMQTRIKLFNLYIEHIKNVCHKLENFRDDTGRKYIEVSENKLLQDYFSDDDPPPIDEIATLNSLGLGSIFDVKEASLPINYWDAIFVSVLGCMQIMIGVVLACAGQVMLGTSVVMSGASDLVTAYRIFEGKTFNWNDYFTQKAVQVAITVISLGVENLASGRGLTLLEGGAQLSPGEAIKEIIKRVTISYTVNSTFDAVINRSSKNILKEFEEEIHSQIVKELNNTLSNPDFAQKVKILMAFDQVAGTNKLEMELYDAAYKIMLQKSQLIVNIVKGVLDRVSSGSGAVQIVAKVASLAITSVEVLNAIEEVRVLAEDVAEAVYMKVEELISRSGKIEYFIASSFGLNGSDASKATEIAQILKDQGFVKTNASGIDELIDEKILAKEKDGGIDSLKLSGNLRNMEAMVIHSIKNLCIAQNADYSKAIASIKENLINQIESVTKNKLKCQVINPILTEISSKLREKASGKVRDFYNFCFDRSHYKEDHARREAEARIRETERLRAANDNQLFEEEVYRQAVGAEGYFYGVSSQRLKGVAAGSSYIDENGEEHKIGESEEYAQGRNLYIIKERSGQGAAVDARSAVGLRAAANDNSLSQPLRKLFVVQEAYANFLMVGAGTSHTSGISLAPEFPAITTALRASAPYAGAAFRTAPTAFLTAAVAQGLHQTAEFESQHPWVNKDFINWFNNPLISKKEKDKLWKQWQDDPLLRAQNTNKSQTKPSVVSTISPTPILLPEHVSSDILITPQSAKVLTANSSRPFNSNVVSSVATASSDNDQESGICKTPYPYSPETHVVNEGMINSKLSNKHKEILRGVEIYGLNPVKVTWKDDNITVNTELPGGELAARECFRNLTGVEAPMVFDNRYFETSKKDGEGKIYIRPDYNANSGLWKVEIQTTKSYEKITFTVLK